MISLEEYASFSRVCFHVGMARPRAFHNENHTTFLFVAFLSFLFKNMALHLWQKKEV